MKRITISAVVLAFVLGACAAGDDVSDSSASDPGETTATSVSTTEAEETTTIPPQVPEPINTIPPTQGGQVQTGEVPAAILDTVLADASVRLSEEVSSPDVVLAEFVIWSDGALGCPEPGMVYTQALVEGYRVVIDRDGTIVDYRINSQGAFRVCEQGITSPSGLGGGSPSPAPINPES